MLISVAKIVDWMGQTQAWRHGGAFRGCAPQMTACAPPNDCLCPPPARTVSPKKLIGSGLPECKSRPETSKIVLIASEFVQNRTSFETKPKFLK